MKVRRTWPTDSVAGHRTCAQVAAVQTSGSKLHKFHLKSFVNAAKFLNTLFIFMTEVFSGRKSKQLLTRK
jgi:hypothetical protein